MFANKILTEKDTDQIRFSILASGSSGNATLVETGDQKNSDRLWFEWKENGRTIRASWS